MPIQEADKNVTVHSVTSNRSAMHRNHAFAWFRAAILGFSVNFVHKKHLAECYQWTVTIWLQTKKRTYPKVAPRVFKIISSTSKQPTFVTSWITSTVRLNINPDTQMRKPLFILRKITGRINPKGRKPITFPNMLENTANVPSCSRYIQNLLISTKGIRLYLYTRCASAALPYSSEKNRLPNSRTRSRTIQVKIIPLISM